MLNEVEALKSLNVERNDLEELVFLSAKMKAYHAEFEALNVDVPEWVDEVRRSLRREVSARNSDAVANQKKSIQLALDGLKTKEEKRKELEDRLAKLNAQSAGV